MCESVHSKPGHWMDRMISSQRQTACSNRNVDMHMCVRTGVCVCTYVPGFVVPHPFLFPIKN
jgi:hypothetical protein